VSLSRALRGEGHVADLHARAALVRLALVMDAVLEEREPGKDFKNSFGRPECFAKIFIKIKIIDFGKILL
jgi:hypothetical protein